MLWIPRRVCQTRRQHARQHEAIFPVYYVFEALAGIRHLLPVSISDPAPITALAFRNERDESIGLIANLTNDPKDVELEVPASALNILSIGEASVAETTKGRLPSMDRIVTDRGRAKVALPPQGLIKLQF